MLIKTLKDTTIFLKFCPYRYRITIFCPSGIGGKIETGCNHLRGEDEVQNNKNTRTLGVGDYPALKVFFILKVHEK